MPKSYYLDNAVINAALRNTPYTPPAIVFIALFTVAPTAAGGGTEVPTGATGYGRQPVVFVAPANGASSNTTDIVFPIALTGWDTITSYGIYDTSSGGNLLYFGNLSAPRAVLVDDQVKFPAGQIQVGET